MISHAQDQHKDVYSSPWQKKKNFFSQIGLKIP
jgi:hypothetical protein